MMVRAGLNSAGYSVSMLAAEVNYSPDALYKAIEGKRRIPKDARPRLARLHLLAGLAVALQDTGYCCFQPVEGDRHFLATTERVHQELHKLIVEINALPPHLLDKLKADDLAPEDHVLLEATDQQMIRLLPAIFSFLVESQDQFQEPVTAMLAGNKKAAS